MRDSPRTSIMAKLIDITFSSIHILKAPQLNKIHATKQTKKLITRKNKPALLRLQKTRVTPKPRNLVKKTKWASWEY